MSEDEDDAKLDGTGLDAYALSSVTNPVGGERLVFGSLRSGIMRDQLSACKKVPYWVSDDMQSQLVIQLGSSYSSYSSMQ